MLFNNFIITIIIIIIIIIIYSNIVIIIIIIIIVMYTMGKYIKNINLTHNYLEWVQYAKQI